MSKKDVIEPGHFKLAGRARPGEDTLTGQNRQKSAKSEQEATTVEQAPAAASSPQTSHKSGVQSTAGKMDTASGTGFKQQPSAAKVPGAFGEEREKDSATRKGRPKTKHAGGS